MSSSFHQSGGSRGTYESAGSAPAVGAAGRGPGASPDDWRFPWIRAMLLLAVVAVLLTLAWGNPTGRDVMSASFRLLAGILSTPLLLEGAWFGMGAMVLYLYTLRRRHLEGDEWVVMEVEDPPAQAGNPDATDATTTTNRDQGGKSTGIETTRG